MKKKILKRILVILLLLSVIISCNKKFLEENPKTFFTVDNVFTTSAQVNQAVISLYSYFREITTSETASVLFLRGNGTDISETSTLSIASTMDNYNTFNAAHNTILDLYNKFYYLISKANLAIYAANLSEISWNSDAERVYAIAQARFFRAWSYCNLAELWGGVPIVTEILDVPKYDFKRETATAVYQYAIDELLAIENDLPITSVAGGRLVRGAAQHYLSELYLGLGIQLTEDGNTTEAQTAYANSINYGDKVINGGVYSLIDSRFGTRKDESLVIIDIYKNGVFLPSEIVDTIQLIPNYYWDLFQEGNQDYQAGNMESIWTIQIDYNAYKSGDKSSKLPYTRMYGADMSYGTNFAHINTMLAEVAGRGIVEQTPTWYWRNGIWEGKWNDDIRNSEAVIRRRFKANVPTSPYYRQVLPWSILYDSLTARKNTNISYCYPISTKITTDKFTGVSDGENRSNLFRDDYAIRLAETILIRAEAKQRKGDKAGAANDINLLRMRAKCGYLVTADDMDDEFNTILDERCRELMYEEHRWNTLLRMRGTIAVDRIKKYMMWEENRVTLTKVFNLLPIPQQIIDANIGNELIQNPGW